MNRSRWLIGLLVISPMALLAPGAMTGRVFYWGVPLLQFYPWQHLAAEMWKAGQWPLWNSLVGSGAPLAANLQTGVFYPLNLLHLILPTEHAQTYTVLLHVILAGLFMFAYLRTLKLSVMAAVIGALAFQLCGFFIARLAFFSVTTAFPWIAAWLWRVEKLVGRDQGSGIRDLRSTSRNALWLALAIGLGVLAGHAQTAVYGLILISGYFVWRSVGPLPNPPPLPTAATGEGHGFATPLAKATTRAGTRAPRHLASMFLLFAMAVIVGLALAAIQLLPAAELTRESQRAGGLDSTKVLTHSFWPLRVLTLLSPDFFGNPAQNNFWGYDNYWENAAYIGVLPLMLALWVVWRRLRRSGRRKTAEGYSTASLFTLHSSLITFFDLTVIISLVLAFGWFTPIYPFLFASVPGFALFQGPARWLVVTIPALCALAAFGAQHWLDEGFSRRTAQRLMLFGAAIAVAGIAALFVLSGRVATFGPATLRLGVLLLITGWLLRSALTDRRSGVVLVVALDLITAHAMLNPTLPPDIYHAPNPTAEAIKVDGAAGRVFYFDADEEAIKFGKYLATDKKFLGYGPNDLDYWLNARAALLPNTALIDGVASANNFDSLIVGRYQNLIDRINRLPIDQARPILSRLNVAYIVSPRSLDLPIVARTLDVTVYRNEAVLPRVWIAPREVDLSQVEAVAGGSSIESLTDFGNTVTIRAASPDDGWLILSDVWYPGWQAYLDRASTPIELANEAFRAVRFPAGEHEVEFHYEPQSVINGAAISLAAALIVAIGLATTNRPRISNGSNE